jgi:hypothetical protein
VSNRDTAEEALAEATNMLAEAEDLAERGTQLPVDIVAAFTAALTARAQVATAAALLDIADAIREGHVA